MAVERGCTLNLLCASRNGLTMTLLFGVMLDSILASLADVRLPDCLSDGAAARSDGRILV